MTWKEKKKRTDKWEGRKNRALNLLLEKEKKTEEKRMRLTRHSEKKNQIGKCV